MKFAKTVNAFIHVTIATNACVLNVERLQRCVVANVCCAAAVGKLETALNATLDSVWLVPMCSDSAVFVGRASAASLCVKLVLMTVAHARDHTAKIVKRLSTAVAVIKISVPVTIGLLTVPSARFATAGFVDITRCASGAGCHASRSACAMNRGLPKG